MPLTTSDVVSRCLDVRGYVELKTEHVGRASHVLARLVGGSVAARSAWESRVQRRRFLNAEGKLGDRDQVIVTWGDGLATVFTIQREFERDYFSKPKAWFESDRREWSERKVKLKEYPLAPKWRMPRKRIKQERGH